MGRTHTGPSRDEVERDAMREHTKQAKPRKARQAYAGICPECHGTGLSLADNTKICPACQGSGTIKG